ncbi:hypothetical protein RI367_000943 [Sorochytrium milnesiophthora]
MTLAWGEPTHLSHKEGDDVCSGTTLSQYIADATLSLDQALVVLRQSATRLQQLHTQDLLCGDLSTDTIVLHFAQSTAPDWRAGVTVELADCSPYHKVGTDGAALSLLHSSHSPHSQRDLRFVAPERTGRMVAAKSVARTISATNATFAHQNRPVDFPSDIYSLGMVVHAAMTGIIPPRNMSLLNIIHYHLAGRPVPLQQQQHVKNDSHAGGLAAFQRLLDLMTAKMPEQRFPSCASLLHNVDLLEQCMASGEEYVPDVPPAPEQLLAQNKQYERTAETEQLLKLQERVYKTHASGVATVSGLSGSGKTMLVQELTVPAFSMRGMFCQGKTDQFERHQPYAALTEACNEAVDVLLMEEQKHLEQFASSLEEALGDKSPLLLGLVPRLQYLLTAAHNIQTMPVASAARPLTPASLSPEQRAGRLHAAFMIFLQTVAAHKPVTLFLDDIQWTDQGTCNLLTSLLGEGLPPRVLVVLAYRPNQVDHNPGAAALLQLLEVQPKKLLRCNVQLGDLSPAAISAMLADVWGKAIHPDASQRLAKLVHKKTQGNPLYVHRCLHMLLQSSALDAIGESGEDFLRNLPPTDNVVDMLVLQIQELPSTTRFLLMLGALLGQTFDLSILTPLLDGRPSNTLHDRLRPAVAAGLVRVVSCDGSMSAEPSDVDSLSLTTLAQRLSLPGLEVIGTMEFTASGTRYQLVPTGCRPTYQWQHDRIQKAAYQLIPAHERPLAHFVVARWMLQQFARALQYAEHAARITDSGTDQVASDVVLAAYVCLIVSSYECKQYDRMKEALDAAHQHCSSPLEQGIICQQEINYLVARGQRPIFTSQQQTDDVLHTVGAMSLDDVADLQHLPCISDPAARAAQNILYVLSGSAYIIDPRLFASIMATSVATTLECGISEAGAFLLACYATVLIDRLQDYNKSHAISSVALQIMESLPPSPLKCPMLFHHGARSLPWVRPASEGLAILEQAIEAGESWMELQFWGYSIQNYLSLKFFAGVNLHLIAAEYDSYMTAIKPRNLKVVELQVGIHQAQLRHLTRSSWSPLAPEICFETHASSASKPPPIQQFWRCRSSLILYYLAGDMEAAMRCIRFAEQQNLSAVRTIFYYSDYLFFRSLTLIRLLLKQQASEEQQLHMTEIEDAVKTFQLWAQNNPTNFAPRYEVLRGCTAWLRGQRDAALEHLDQTISLARKASRHDVQAVTEEMVAVLWTSAGRPCLAAPYLAAAARSFRKWGAEWKANSMLTDTDDGNSVLCAQSEPAEYSRELSNVKPDAVDLETIYDWTIALGTEQARDGLLRRFMQTALLYGASREGRLMWAESPCTVSMLDDATSQVQTVICPDGEAMTTMVPLPPPPIVNYVLRTKETLTDSSDVVQRGALAHHGSFLLMPVPCKGKCAGVLYLRNDLSTRGFADDRKRIGLLQLLSSQLAVSLENLQLLAELRARNESLEDTVQQRTRDLEQVNSQLMHEVEVRKTAEQHAVQAATANRVFLQHMSHELRTPLNCIIGMAELMGNTAMADEQRDLWQPLMSSAGDLLQIVNDVLDLSKMQAGKMSIDMCPMSLREVMENALDSVALAAARKSLMLTGRYPATVPSTITSDAGRIGQVLRNLLSNAVKFTERGQVTLDVSAVMLPDGRYLFTVKCIDTGIGIAADQAHLLFKKFSQIDSTLTRKVGGTGLGLKISRKLAKLLSGDLVCSSEHDKGSTFTFTFRAQAEPPPPLSHPATASGAEVTLFACNLPGPVFDVVQGYLALDGFRLISVGWQDWTRFEQKLDQTASYIFLFDEQSVAKGLLPTHYAIICILDLSKDMHTAVKPEHRPLAGTSFAYLRQPLRQSRLLGTIDVLVTSAMSSVLVSDPASATPPGATATAPAAEQTVTPTTSSDLPRFRLQVLVAEDNPINRDVAKRMLRKFGIEPAMAVDGQDAVNVCEKREFDLILMDLQMPKMDGLQATEHIRAKPAPWRQPIIIACTAHAYEEDRAQCLNAGMTDFLGKPLSLAALRQTLLKYFTPL